MSTLSAILKDTPRSVTDLRPDVPRDLARIIKRALVKDPEHRYQTAKDLRNDLETFKEDLASGVIDAPPRGASTVAAPPLRNNRLAAITGTVGALVLLAVAAWYFTAGSGDSSGPAGAGGSSRPFDQVRLSRLTSTGRVSWSALSADGRYVVHVVFEGGKQGLWLRQVATSSNVPIVPADDVRYDGVGFSPDGNFVYYVAYPGGQSFAGVYQVPVLGGTPRKIIDDVDTPLAFSPNGREFAFVRGSSVRGETAVMIANTDGSNERTLSARKNPLSYLLNNLSWSPDGSTIVTIQRADQQNRAKLVALDVKSAQQTDVGGTLWAYIDTVAWMPDGRGLVLAAQEDAPGAPTQVWYVSYPSGEPRRITNDLNNYGQVSVGADGRSLVVVQRESLAHVWVAPFGDLARAKQITSGTRHSDGTRGLAWTRDGRVVYSSSAGGHPDLWIVDASGDNRRQLTADPADDFSPTVTPDGRSILFASSRDGGSIWQMDLDGGNLRPLVSTHVGRWPLVSADSKWIYFTSFSEAHRTVWRMPLAGGTPERLTGRWDEMGVTQDGLFFHPTMMLVGLMPDGAHGIGQYMDASQRGTRLALVPLTGEGTPTRLDFPAAGVALTADRHFVYFEMRDGVPTLVRRPIAGGPATVLGTFPNESSLNFAMSPDGKQIALSRGTTTSDVVLISQEK